MSLLVRLSSANVLSFLERRIDDSSVVTAEKEAAEEEEEEVEKEEEDEEEEEGARVAEAESAEATAVRFSPL